MPKSATKRSLRANSTYAVWALSVSDSHRIHSVKNASKRVPDFEITLDGCICFPPNRGVRVVCVKTDEPSGALKTVYKNIEFGSFKVYKIPSLGTKNRVSAKAVTAINK